MILLNHVFTDMMEARRGAIQTAGAALGKEFAMAPYGEQCIAVPTTHSGHHGQMPRPVRQGVGPSKVWLEALAEGPISVGGDSPEAGGGGGF